MSGELESIRRHMGEVAGAGVHIKYTPARLANEMVMVVFSCQLIPCRFSRQLDRDDFTELFERSNGAVNRCNAELWDISRCLF